MEYILNQSEYQEFITFKKAAKDDGLKRNALEEARIHILKLAEFTCIHDKDEPLDNYCDDCPCSPIGHNNYSDWKLVCGRAQNYSK